MSIEWSIPTREDLKGVVASIQGDDPAAASAVASKILAATQQLAGFPGLGRPGRVGDTRDQVVPGLPCVVVYLAEKGASSFCVCCTRPCIGLPEGVAGNVARAARTSAR